MNPDQIVETARRLQCGPDAVAVACARMLAEHGARSAHANPGDPAQAIAAAFDLDATVST